jgi:hypothetical protein
MADPTQTRVAQSAETTREAAQVAAGAAVKTKSAAERATELAADRTIFAAERTYAAWVRTGLVALASGLGSKKLLDGAVPSWMILGTGTMLSCSPSSASGQAFGVSSLLARPHPSQTFTSYRPRCWRRSTVFWQWSC